MDMDSVVKRRDAVALSLLHFPPPAGDRSGQSAAETMQRMVDDMDFLLCQIENGQDLLEKCLDVCEDAPHDAAVVIAGLKPKITEYLEDTRTNVGGKP